MSGKRWRHTARHGTRPRAPTPVTSRGFGAFAPRPAPPRSSSIWNGNGTPLSSGPSLCFCFSPRHRSNPGQDRVPQNQNQNQTPPHHSARRDHFASSSPPPSSAPLGFRVSFSSSSSSGGWVHLSPRPAVDPPQVSPSRPLHSLLSHRLARRGLFRGACSGWLWCCVCR
jgi:hypothetical protein